MLLVKNYEAVMVQLRPKLEEYLQSHGINTASNFHCIHPDHDDRHPSCGIQGNNKETFHCFSCQAAGDIFTACHYLENKPIKGPGFILENVAYLAERFNVPMEREKPTEMQLYEYDTYRAYARAAEYIIHATRNDKVQAEINKRGWSEETIRSYGVGTVVTFKAFKEHLKDHWEVSFLQGIDLDRQDMFNEDCLIFTIKDEHGRPVGFSSRNLNHINKGDGNKYVNQKITGVKCNIYRKGTRLYGLDQILAGPKKRRAPVYIMEGYTDVLTAREHGLIDCVALGGSSMSIEQLYLLKDHNLTDIILCLDGDVAGKNGTAHLLDTVLVGHKDINVRVVKIPDDHDPDSFIRERGIDEFFALHKWSAFEWRLANYNGDQDSDEAVCNAMIPFIVSEQNIITQRSMINHLSLTTGIDVTTIYAEVQRKANDQERKKAIARESIIEKMVHKIQRDQNIAELAIVEAQTSLYDLMRQYNEDNLSEDACLGIVKVQKEREENKSDEFAGFILGEDLEILQDALNGEWKEDVFCVLGGRANSGKSSFLVKLAYAIAKHEQENDACVIYHTIDDTAQQLLPKFVTVIDGTKRLQINQVSNPNYYASKGYDVLERRDVAYAVLGDLVRRGRLIIKDANDGQSLLFAESLLHYYREKYPERKLVYVLDNFHKLHDLAAAETDRGMYKSISQKMKYLSGKYHACILATVEYTKMQFGERPTNNNVSETVQIEYDANLAMHIYNDLHDMREKAQDFHIANDGTGQRVKMPRIEVSFGKNKITAFKNNLYFDFFPASSDFVGVQTEIVVKERDEQKGGSSSGRNDDYPDFLK